MELATAHSARASRWNTRTRVRWIGKPLVFALGLVPFVLIALRTAGWLQPDLGANPVEALLEYFGEWGLRFLMLALAVTPLRRLSGYAWVGQFRRMIGLFAFFYVLVHFLVYLVLDQQLAAGPILEDILERPFITLGVIGLLLLTALAATSTNAARRRLGRNWNRLHKSVYVVGVLGVWHYWWQVKKDITEPAIYAAILAVLLGIRLAYAARARAARRP
jgi:sulfoxide reductase heme-binding subunit YedZ